MSADFHNSADSHDSMPEVPEASASAKLLRKVRRATRNSRSRRKSTTPCNSARSDEIGSENSQVLYMKSSKSLKRASRESLSSISNNSVGSKDTITETKPPGLKVDRRRDDVAWKVIDREIFEWQYVCRTGRPYWWSPESKYLRLRKMHPRVFHAPNPRIWMKDWNDSAKPDYETTRRAISDSYLADPATIGDVAHLIAVQLLSACFTISPDHVGIPAPNYMTFGRAEFPDLLDYRMISSLRMHTHFRYSPAFGHQPRNTSPVESWPNNYEAYDGPAQNPEPSEADIEPSETTMWRQRSRRRRVHRALHMSDDSQSSCSYDSNEDSRRLRQSSSADGSGNFITDAHFTERRARRRKPGGRQMPSPDEEEMNADETNRGYHTSPPSKSRHSLSSVLRSEPHPVYIQPVKELVVKRWNGIRRHIKVGHQSTNSGETKSADATPSTSEPITDLREAFNVGSDGKERRRRARERGDILSSSTEGTPHYNTPVSVKTPVSDSGISVLASGAISPAIDIGDVHSKSSDAVYASSASLQFLSTGDPKLTARPEPERHTSTRSAPSGEVTSESRTESGYFVPQRAKTAASFTPRSRRANRRSLLSEVCTPEDFEEIRTAASSPGGAEGDTETVMRSVLSTIGSDMSPADELPLVLVKSPSLEEGTLAEVQKITYSATSDEERRPGITRANTSGTQLFTPRDDSFEVDGIPIGPGEKEWEQPEDTKGKRRERSFL